MRDRWSHLLNQFQSMVLGEGKEANPEEGVRSQCLPGNLSMFLVFQSPDFLAL